MEDETILRISKLYLKKLYEENALNVIQKFYSITELERRRKYFHQFHRRQLTIAVLGDVEDKVVLDLGGAEGLFCLQIACKKPSIVVDLDLARTFLKFGKKLVKGHDLSQRIEYVQADVEALPFKLKSVDYILCAEVIEHLQTPENCMKEISKALKNNGVLVLSTPVKSKIKDHLARLLKLRTKEFVGHFYEGFERKILVLMMKRNNFKIDTIKMIPPYEINKVMPRIPKRYIWLAKTIFYSWTKIKPLHTFSSQFIVKCSKKRN